MSTKAQCRVSNAPQAFRDCTLSERNRNQASHYATPSSPHESPVIDFKHCGHDCLRATSCLHRLKTSSAPDYFKLQQSRSSSKLHALGLLNPQSDTLQCATNRWITFKSDHFRWPRVVPGPAQRRRRLVFTSRDIMASSRRLAPVVSEPDPHEEEQKLPIFHRVFAVFCGVGSLRARYTISKLRDFDDYSRSTSSWRHAVVIFLTPLPSLATSLLPVLIPLQDPMLGVARNSGYIFHFFTTLFFISLGSVFQIRAPCGISHEQISNIESVCIAAVASSFITATATLLGYVWRFPVPFIWVVAYVPFVAGLVFAHVMVLRRKLLRDVSIRGPLLAFLPSYFMQGFQVVIYPAFSAAFEVSDQLGQIALTLLFPFIKYAFLQILRKLSRHLAEDGNEVAVGGVEICATMYQSMIMQNTPSPVATALVIGLDVVQGLFAIHVFMDKHSVVPLEDIVGAATEIVRSDSREMTDSDLSRFASIKKLPRLPCILLSNIFRQRRDVVPAPPARRRHRKVTVSGNTPQIEKQILTHALEIVQSAESILIIEYFEVSVPIVNALFLLIASQHYTAVYNPKLQPYYHDGRLLGPALKSLALYTLLQGLSVVMMHVVMWRRFRVSATTLLAYVLERHAWSLQGKLVTWLSAIFQLPVVHYGVDFKLKFKFPIDYSRVHHD